MSIISNASLFIRQRLTEALGSSVTSIYPIDSPDANLPYIAYGRTGLRQTSVKTGLPGPMSATVEITVYAETYNESVRLCEAVIDAFDGASAPGVRRCVLVNAAEDYDFNGNAYQQTITYELTE